MSLPGRAQPNEVFYTILYVIIDYLFLAPNEQRRTRRKAITHLETAQAKVFCVILALYTQLSALSAHCRMMTWAPELL
jgi:hypothetical protein